MTSGFGSIFLTIYLILVRLVRLVRNDKCHSDYKEEMIEKCSKDKKYQKYLEASWYTSFLFPFFCIAASYSVHL